MPNLSQILTGIKVLLTLYGLALCFSMPFHGVAALKFVTAVLVIIVLILTVTAMGTEFFSWLEWM